MKLFDLALKLNGFPLDEARKILGRILLVPEEDYDAYLEERKKSIVDYHLKHNTFYQNLAKDFDGSWESLPVMKKIDFQRPLEERLSEGFTPKNVYVNKTSGSSGDPMVFARDKMAHALTWANITRRFAWYGIDFNKSWQARFYGRTLDFVASKKLKLKDYLSRRYRFDIFDLSDAALEKVVEKFRKHPFYYINGYTTAIVPLAKYLQRKGLILSDICPTLKVCVTTSEMLFPDDRIVLEKWLGVPVVNEYGASELEVIAFENPDGTWNLNAETIFVEILDKENKPVAPGVKGRIVVTSLDNKAHPFIRYEVGDYGILDTKSTAKHPILKELIGRTNDVAILPSGKKPAGMTFYSITKKLFEDDGNVKEFVIRQTAKDTFELHFTSERELTDAEKNRISSVLTDYLEPGLHFIFFRKDVLERTKSGKLKQFTSSVKE